jgi:hypothetical protein
MSTIKKLWQSLVQLFGRIWRFIKPFVKPVFQFVSVSVILAAGWYAFIGLVTKPPIDTTPVLIMVWSSIFVLLLTLFPKMLDRIKRIKIKDFELELQDAVAKSTTNEYISLPDSDEFAFSQKGDFHNLEQLLVQAVQQPAKPILLVVNIKNGAYISIPMLFIYLFFLDLVGKNITILFIKSGGIKDYIDIRRDSIIGAVSGKTVLHTMYKKFPHLSKIFELSKFSNSNSDFEEFIKYGRFREVSSEFIFHQLYDSLRNTHSYHREFLTTIDVQNWFRGELNNRIVEVDLTSEDYKTIREALVVGDEFILSIKDKKLRSIISLCYFSKTLSKKILADIS